MTASLRRRRSGSKVADGSSKTPPDFCTAIEATATLASSSHEIAKHRHLISLLETTVSAICTGAKEHEQVSDHHNYLSVCALSLVLIVLAYLDCNVISRASNLDHNKPGRSFFVKT